MKSKHLSSLFQWCIIIFTAIVVGQALYDNWREVQSLELDKETWWYVIVAVGSFYPVSLLVGSCVGRDFKKFTASGSLAMGNNHFHQKLKLLNIYPAIFGKLMVGW